MWKELPVAELYGAVSDINEFLKGLNELTRLESASERAVWLSRNYQDLLTVTKSLSSKLLKGFGRSVCITAPFHSFIYLYLFYFTLCLF
jgi:hypothetical protein